VPTDKTTPRTTLFGRYQVAEPHLTLDRLHAYAGTPLREVDHEPNVDVLDQEDLIEQGIDTATLIPGATEVDALGSCVANSGVEGLSNVLDETAFLAAPGKLNLPPLASYADTVGAEKFAIALYHLITDATGDPGSEWPPTDCGSSGPYLVQGLKSLGLIAGDKVASGAQNLVSLMQTGCIQIGQPWYNAWMTPDSNGFIDAGGLEAAVKSGLAGGHETTWSAIVKLTLTETGLVVPDKTILRGRNHWTKSWGDNGSYFFHLSTFVSLGAQCDYRQLVAAA